MSRFQRAARFSTISHTVTDGESNRLALERKASSGVCRKYTERKKKSSPFLIMQLNVVVQRIGAKVRLIVETCVSSFRYLRLTLGMDAGKFFAAFGGTIMII